MRRPRLGTTARLFYYGILALFVLIGLLAALEGWWLYTLASLLFAVAFLATAPFVLGAGWKPPKPTSTRRPVIRRRR
jgi:hypothetical protein